MRLLFGIFVLSFACCAAATDTNGHWLTPLQIERLSIAVALADYPLPASQLRNVIGVPNDLPVVLGGGPNRMHSNAEFMVLALSDPDAPNGFFGLRIRFLGQIEPRPSIARPGYAPKDEDKQVSACEVVFWSSSPGLIMTVDPEEGYRSRIGELRKMMREKGLNPREFSVWVDPERTVSVQQPNQPVETTSPAVTPAAGQPARQQ
jgi:hypothetical protein